MSNQFDFAADEERPARRTRDQDDQPRSRYRCPHCGTSTPPQFISKVSPLGWVIFCLGLFAAIIGCLIGLLFRHNVRVCPVCGKRL